MYSSYPSSLGKTEENSDPCFDGSYAFHDSLASAIISSLAAFGRGVSELADLMGSGETGDKDQSPSSDSAAAANALNLFEDFQLASSLARMPLSRLQLPLFHEATSQAVADRKREKERDAAEYEPHFHLSDPAAFSQALWQLHEQLQRVVSPSAQHALERAGGRARNKRCYRCPYHTEAAQIWRRQQHEAPHVAKQETQRHVLATVARLFDLCCRVRSSSILYSCFLLLACCNSGRREDPFLRFIASAWLLCDEADEALGTIDPTDPHQWRAAGESTRSSLKDFTSGLDLSPSPEREPSVEPSEVFALDESEPSGSLLSLPVEGMVMREVKGRGGGNALQRLLSGGSLSRINSKQLLDAKAGNRKAGKFFNAGCCDFLVTSRCQCVVYVRGFLAGLLPVLLWSYLTRSLLPPCAQPWPHLLSSMLEEAKRGLGEGDNKTFSSFPLLRERILQQEKECGQLIDNTSGLEDVLLLFAGSAESVLSKKKPKKSFGAAVATSVMLPEVLRLDGFQLPEVHETNSLLHLLSCFGDGSRCAALLTAQQQRCIRLWEMISHAPREEERGSERPREEGGTHLVASSEGEAEAPPGRSEHFIIQREPPLQAVSVTKEGLQDLCLRVLACFSCYAGSCAVLESSVAVAAGAAKHAFVRENLLPPTSALPSAASWAQCALWAQQQLLVRADEHVALLAAGLTEAMTAPSGLAPLSLSILMPQALLSLAQQQESSLDVHTSATKEDVALDALAAGLVDGALLPLDCSCGGVCGKETEPEGHCLNAAAASRVSIERLLHLEVDPAKTGLARLTVGEPLMLQICRTLGVLLHAAKAESSTRVPSWTISLGGIESPANTFVQTVEQWRAQLQAAASHAAFAEHQVQRLLQQAKVITTQSDKRESFTKDPVDQQPPLPRGFETLPPEAVQHQLHLMAMLHQAQHFGCNCCCCSVHFPCSQLGYLFDLNATVYRSMQEKETAKRFLNGSSDISQLWPLLRQELLVRRLQSAARSCMLKAERDWLPQSYWGFVALSTISW